MPEFKLTEEEKKKREEGFALTDDDKSAQEDFSLTDEAEAINGFSLEGEAVPSVDQNLIKSMEEAESLAIIPSLSEVYDEIKRGLVITIRDIQAGGTAVQREAEERARYNAQQLKIFQELAPDLLPTFEDSLENNIRRAELQAVKAKKFQLQMAVDELVQKGIPPQSIGGGIVRDLTRISAYAAITIPFLRGLGAGPVTSSIAGAAIADLAAFEGDEPRISNLLAEVNQPDFTKAVFEYLAADPNDPLIEQKFKQSIEGVILGGVGEGVGRLVARGFYTVRGFKRKILGQKIGASAVSKPIPRTGSADPEVTALEGRIEEQATELFRGQFGGEPLPEITVVKSGTQTPAEMTLDEVTKMFQSKIHEFDVGGLLTPKQIAEKVIAFRDIYRRRLDIPLANRERGRALFNALKANSRALEAASKRTLSEHLQAIKNDLIINVVDRSGVLKNRILKSGGPEGKRAVEDLVLAQGASPAAGFYYREAWKRIFGVRQPLGLFTSMDEGSTKALNWLIMARRIREIKTYDPNWQPPIDLPGKRTKGGQSTATDWDDAMSEMRLDYGESAWADMTGRADFFFSETKKALDILHKAGVISDEGLLRLGRHEYSPIKFLEELDPVMATAGKGANAISVPSSGIPKLGRGDEKAILENGDEFLSQILARTHTRAARNRANQSIYDFADKNPDNGVVALGRVNEKTGGLDINKAPKDGEWAQISVMFDGERKNMFLRREFVDQWNASPVGTHWAFSVLSGSTLIRPLATGVNPEFILNNFPRDLMYSWLNAAEGTLYPSNPIVAAKQMATSLRETFSDTWRREGAFIDAMDEGLLMSLMTHGAQAAKPVPGHLSRAGRRMAELQHILGYLNETSEIWVRLMNRNAALKKGLAEGVDRATAGRHATFVARSILDFAQGGIWTKKVDRAIPYVNAGVQGMRGTARTAKENPKIFAAKVAYAMSTFGGMWMANQYVNPEAWNQIPAYIRNRYMVITTPYYRTDLEGNRRYMYFKLPIDHSMMPIKAATDAMFERTFNGKVPDNTTMETIKTITGVVPGLSGTFPPSFNAISAVWANYDWWRDEKVWKGQEGIPKYMERTVTGERPTSRVAEELGGLIGPAVEGVQGVEQFTSPARMEVAFKSLIPSNIYTDLVGKAAKEFIELVDEDQRTEMYRTLQQKFKDAPFGRRLIGETHPLVANIDDIRNNIRAALGERIPIVEELDLIVQNTLVEKGDITTGDVQRIARWIEQQDVLNQQMLSNRFSNSFELTKIFKHVDVGSIPGFIPRDEWIWISSAPPKARAAIIVNEYADAQEDLNSDLPEERAVGRKKVRLLGQMLRVMPGFNTDPKSSPEFAAALIREAQERGVQLPR